MKSILIINLIIQIYTLQTLQLILNLSDLKILSPQQMTDIKNLKLTINSGTQSFHPIQQNKFIIPLDQLARGTTYFVQVVSKYYLFQALNLEIKDSGEISLTSVHPWSRKKIAKLSSAYLRVLERINYFEIESTFSIMSLLTNSYVLMLGFGVIMMYCYNNIMPKMQQAQHAQVQSHQR